MRFDSLIFFMQNLETIYSKEFFLFGIGYLRKPEIIFSETVDIFANNAHSNDSDSVISPSRYPNHCNEFPRKK